MEAWHDVLESSQGQMLTRGEKLEITTKKLNETSLKESWGVEFSVEQVQNKMDGMTKKAMYPLPLLQLRTEQSWCEHPAYYGKEYICARDVA